MNNKINLGVIADFYRCHNMPCDSLLTTQTNYTTVSALHGDMALSDLPSLRAQALLFAWRGVAVPAITHIVFNHTSDLCFQIYAVCCLKANDLIQPIFNQNFEDITDLAILRYFNDIGSFNSCYQQDSVYDFIASKVYEIFTNDTNVIETSSFNLAIKDLYISQFTKNWNDLINTFCDSNSAQVKYFYKQGCSTVALFRALIKHSSCGDKYRSALLNELLCTASTWTQQQFDEVKELLQHISPKIPVVRYGNYKMLYDLYGMQPFLFELGEFDTCATMKLNLLSFSERVLVISNTLKKHPAALNWISCEFDNELKQVFYKYSSDLVPAYKLCRERIFPSCNILYEIEFLKCQIYLTPFLSELSVRTLPVFLAHIEEPEVFQSVYSWCDARNELFRLSPVKNAFSKSIQTKIIKSSTLISKGKHPAGTEEFNMCLKLQPFACKHNFHFVNLLPEEQYLLGNAVYEDNGTLECDKTESEICTCVKQSLHFTNNTVLILRAMLKFGTVWAKQYDHFYNDLDGYECDFDSNVICTSDFLYVQQGQKLDDAKYFRGHSFNRTRSDFKHFSETHLKYFEWCGTDNVFVDNSLTKSTNKAFAIYFCKHELHRDISSWDIQKGSPLLQHDTLIKLNLDVGKQYLCRGDYVPGLSEKIPLELLQENLSVCESTAIVKNLELHSLDWYKQFDNWQNIIKIQFEWNADLIKYWRVIGNLFIHTRKQLYLLAYKHLDYESVVSDTSFINKLS